MNRRLSGCLLCLLAVSLLVLASGCSGRVTATGQLKQNGKALVLPEKEKLLVNFYPDGETDTSKSYLAEVNNADGTFVVKDKGSGIPRGKYKVTVVYNSPYPMGKDQFQDKYSIKNSPLIVEVTGAPLEIDLNK